MALNNRRNHPDCWCPDVAGSSQSLTGSPLRWNRPLPMGDFDLVVRGRRSKVRHVPAGAPAGAARGAGPRRPVRSKVSLVPAVTPLPPSTRGCRPIQDVPTEVLTGFAGCV